MEMFKAIPGNPKLRIDKNRTVIDYNGEIYPTDGKFIKISLFNKLVTVELDWLFYFAWFECGVIPNIQNLYQHIDFIDTNISYLRIRCKKMMVFKKPIEYIDGFRIIPNFPRYAIDRKSNILDITTNELISKRDLDDKGYLTTYIYNPDRNCNRTVKIHRLVALAWIENNSFINKPLVNHIDGNKTNNDVENLEWCSSSENVVHALNNGLNNTSIKTLVRNIDTGEIKEYRSISLMCKDLGLSIGTSTAAIKSKLPGYLWKDKYEIKESTDTTPWFYENKTKTLGKVRFTIQIVDNDGNEIKTFYRVKDICIEFNISFKSENIEDFKKRFEDTFKDLKLVYTKHGLNGPYYAINIITRQIHIFSSLIQCSDFIKIKKATLQIDLARLKKYIYNKTWIVVLNTESLNLADYKEKPDLCISLEVTDIKGNVTFYKSIKQASRIIGINHKTITAKLNTGKFVKGYKFRAIN